MKEHYVYARYQRGQGFIRLTMYQETIDILGSVWNAFATTDSVLVTDSPSQMILLHKEALEAMLEESQHVSGNKQAIATVKGILKTQTTIKGVS